MEHTLPIIRRAVFILMIASEVSACDDKIDKHSSRDTSSVENLKIDTPDTSRQTIKTADCFFNDPDTSVSGININDPESATRILRVKRLNGDTTYRFFSKNKTEVLSVTVHPGSYYSSISIFQVAKPSEESKKSLKSTIARFRTEKGITLGLTKKDVISKLGECYTVADSTTDNIEIRYRIETPRDSKTGLLARHNMPFYYATYIFKHNILNWFEMGFEYP